MLCGKCNNKIYAKGTQQEHNDGHLTQLVGGEAVSKGFLKRVLADETDMRNIRRDVTSLR